MSKWSKEKSKDRNVFEGTKAPNNGEWKKYKLGDILEVKYGKDHKRLKDGLIPTYGSGGIMRYVESCLSTDTSILIPRKGSLNNIFYINTPFWAVDTIFWTKINKNCVNPKFLFYQLKLFDFASMNVGSAVPSLTVPVINALDILLPPLSEQEAIAEVLSSLDDKIDLLHRQNTTLEALAQTYFRQWFVEDASENWKVGNAENYFNITIGKTPPRNESIWFSENPSDYVWVSISDMGKSETFISSSKEYLTKEAVKHFNIRIAPKNSILLSFKLTVGRISIAQCNLTTNEAIAHFVSKNEFDYEYLYCYLKSFDYYSLGSTSSIATAINSKIIKSMQIVMPPQDLLKNFHIFSKPLFLKMEQNTIQILTLQKLRDTLLPKLISGDVNIKNNIKGERKNV